MSWLSWLEVEVGVDQVRKKEMDERANDEGGLDETVESVVRSGRRR